METYENLIISEDIKFKKLLGYDLYTTVLAIWKDRKVVVKFYHSHSDETNEYEFLTYISKTKKYNKPYFKFEFSNSIDMNIKVDNVTVCMEDIFKIIIYDWIPGVTVKDMVFTQIEKDKLESDIKEELKYLHDLGFVAGNILGKNIIKRDSDSKYALIDFCRIFSTTHQELFPPMRFHLDDFEWDGTPLPTQKDDLDSLDRILENIKVVKE